jgi:hypothetical protein
MALCSLSKTPSTLDGTFHHLRLTSSIIRCAAAFGVDSIFLAPTCASPFNPQCLRSSAGTALLMAYGSLADAEKAGIALIVTKIYLNFSSSRVLTPRWHPAVMSPRLSLRRAAVRPQPSPKPPRLPPPVAMTATASLAGGGGLLCLATRRGVCLHRGMLVVPP